MKVCLDTEVLDGQLRSCETNEHRLGAKSEQEETRRLAGSVVYYMNLADYALGQDGIVEQYNALCRLLAMIAQENPQDMSEDRGDARRYPRVRIVDGMTYEDGAELDFAMFESIYFSDENFEECTEEKGGDVYFLTLALWYEVCMLRDKMRVCGIRFRSFEKDIATALRKGHDERMKGSREKSFYTMTHLPHFEVESDESELLAILKGMKEVEWEYNKSKCIGFFDGEVSEEEWLSALKGVTDGRPEVRRKIPWRAKYVCKSFVSQYLGGNYELAEKVFCLSGGKDIKGLSSTNIYRKGEICDLKEGKIARIIREAKQKEE
ncbi:MAG: hypothetical protein J5526_00025 [Bacteroidales bacterium]|nr:hypothetical protein [Bacteroidales bacterium]